MAYDGPNVVIWREPWTMHEYSIAKSDYMADGPKDNVAKMKKIGAKLSEPQAALHRSMALKELNWATEGKIRMVESYHASKAWIKRMAKDKLECPWKDELGCNVKTSYDTDDFDMRHMRKPVHIASVLLMLRAYE